tara:strand:+ start:230 stop:544 length:315 start_codon:yes stop_codon:yes gene_type:complete
MSQVTSGTEYVENDKAEIEVGGTKLKAYIEGEIEYTYTYYPAEGMSGRMEDAIPSSDEITLDSVDLTVTLYGHTDDGSEIKFMSNCQEFYIEHFGELESSDVEL